MICELMMLFFEMEMAEKAIRPLTKASFIMQRDSNTLADVLFMLGSLHQEFENYPLYCSEFVSLLEKRWKQQEQPLLLLAFMLHPKYPTTFRVMARFDGKLSVLSMTNYAILYYKKFIADDFG